MWITVCTRQAYYNCTSKHKNEEQHYRETVKTVNYETVHSIFFSIANSGDTAKINYEKNDNNHKDDENTCYVCCITVDGSSTYNEN